MGDLVDSEGVASTERLHDRFNAAVTAQNAQHEGQLVSPLTITLGDEFQGLTRTLADTLPIARKLRLRLLDDGIECRFAIGQVELRTPLNPERAWNMMGPGLARTREKLDEKRAGSFYRFAIGDDPAIETALEAIGAALTAIERRWTDLQRHDIAASLEGLTVVEIARSRKVSVHNIYKVRSAGSFDTYVVLWNAVRDIFDHLDKRREDSCC